MTPGLPPSSQIAGMRSNLEGICRFLDSRYFTITPGDVKSISKTLSIHGFSAY